jgi:homoserine kinase
LGVALSGAGPTLLALVDKQNNERDQLEQFMLDTLLNENIKAQMKWLQPEALGVQVLTEAVSMKDLAAAHV